MPAASTITKAVIGGALAGALVVVLSACTAAAAGTAAGTAADYQVVVDAAEVVLADAVGFVPVEAIIRSEVRVTDLETSQHRMVCGDATSQYNNRVNLYLTAQTDEITLIDDARSRYTTAGWTETDLSGDGAEGEPPDPDGAYIHTFGSPEGYGLTISRGEDADGGTILQFIVYSPCIADPADKSSTWGLRERR